MHLSLISLFLFSLCIDYVYNYSAGQCQRTGYQSCLNYDGRCVSKEINCSTKCSRTSDCTQASTQCCLQDYCQKTNNCYNYVSNSSSGPSMVVIILPVFAGVCVLIFIICIIINVVRRRRMNGQQSIKVEPLSLQQVPLHRFDANDAMTRVNHLNIYSANVQQEKLLRENVIIPQVVLPPKDDIPQNYLGQPQHIEIINGSPFILQPSPQQVMENQQNIIAGNSSNLKASYL